MESQSLLLADGLWAGGAVLAFGGLAALLGAGLDAVYPAWRRTSPVWAAGTWGLSGLAGLGAGAASLRLVDSQLAHSVPAAAAAWIGLPLGGGLLLRWLDRLRHPERRAHGAAFVAGAIFALGWLTVRLAFHR